MNPQDPRAQAPGTAPDRPADRGVTGPDTSTLTVVDPAQAASLRVVGVGGEESLEYTPEERRHVRRRSWALLRQLAAPVRGTLLLTALLVLVSNAARAAVPLIIAWAIDRGLPQVVEAVRTGADPWPVVVLVGGVYALTGLTAGVLLGVYQWLTAKASQRMLLALRVRVFQHTQRLSLGFHETYTSGRVISRQTSDLEALRELLDQGVSSLVSGVLFMVFTSASIVLLDAPSFLVLLIAFVPVAIAVRWYPCSCSSPTRRGRPCR